MAGTEVTKMKIKDEWVKEARRVVFGANCHQANSTTIVETIAAVAPLIAAEAWKRGVRAGTEAERRKNRSGCCCEIDDDGETVLQACAAHAAWVAGKQAEAIEACALSVQANGGRRQAIAEEIRREVPKWLRTACGGPPQNLPPNGGCGTTVETTNTKER